MPKEETGDPILRKEWYVMGTCSENRKSVPELFGSSVFNDDVMQERLPKDVYKSLRKTIDEGKDLDLNVANAVANAMKDWAVEKGATHYTHWFQPLNGITAEKHDSFISPTSDGRVIMQFSGKELVRGEPDASSFPSGGLRATFEARGYTAWDPTSYAFVKGDSLYIPTAFCSYSGETLDKKTPLLRSMEDLSTQALRIVRLFGDQKTKRVITTVGPEQEYFLVDKKLYEERPDLRFCGRTLFGAKAPKGQELDDHYFGAIKPRVAAFMKELDEELWKLGILAKTKHNEVAPAQHELAPIFTTTNIATDHNQLTMETMKNVAARHGLVCLLNEKPFEGVNGSGKHNNWSVSTDTGKNLLDPGKEPAKNTQFLLFLAAIIKGVDEYQDLLRISVASAGNDHRLGANEAPPAIVSMFLGDELAAILDAIEKDEPYTGIEEKKLQTGVHVLPDLSMDTTDRNRTSPFAFTGNKFEFRMVGASQSIGLANTVTNAIVADALATFAARLEQAADKAAEVRAIVADTWRDHGRIVFNGNNYSAEWRAEAARRGLPDIPDMVRAAASYITEKNVAMFERTGVLTQAECHSRYEITLEGYAKHMHIDAATMLEMVSRSILPASYRYLAEVAKAERLTEQCSCACASAKAAVEKLCVSIDVAAGAAEALRRTLDAIDCAELNEGERAGRCREMAHREMAALRRAVDALEMQLPQNFWPVPDYSALLYDL